MKEDKNIEQILLNDEEYEKISTKKIESDFVREIDKSKNKTSEIITDIKFAPKNKLFSKDAIYLILNKNSRTKSYVNGIQAEGFLGNQTSTREKFLTGEIDSFTKDDYFVKFLKVRI